jgi:hypothetical protein
VKIQFTVTGSVFVPDDHFLERNPEKLAWSMKRVLENAVQNKIDWKHYAKDITATVTITPSITQ